MERADRSLFVQEILLSTLSEKLQLSSDDSDEDPHQVSLGLFNSDRISQDHRKKDNRKNMIKHVGVDNKKSDKEPPPH
jgi:hypothetical protein